VAFVSHQRRLSVSCSWLIAREIILKLDQATKHQTLTDAEFELRKDLKFKRLGLSSLKRTIARQRSRVRYLADSDTNTKYFHLLARGRKRRNTITRLQDGENTCSTHEDIEMALFNHFKQVFGQPGQTGFELDFQAIDIQPTDLSALDLPFSVEEVKVVVREMPVGASYKQMSHGALSK
jgi:hypothetical protein